MKVLCNLGGGNHCPFPEYKVIKNILFFNYGSAVISKKQSG